VIIEKSIEISPSDTYGFPKKRVFLESADMMHNVVDLLEEEGFTLKRIDNLGKVYTIKNFR